MLGQTIDARLSWSDPVLSRFTIQGTMKDAASSIIYEALITIMPVITMMTAPAKHQYTKLSAPKQYVRPTQSAP